MDELVTILQGLFLIPVITGSVYALLTAVSTLIFCARRPRGVLSRPRWPAASILKPVFGLEKNLAENLRSACMQEYPDYQVVLSLQRLDDPALPVVREVEREFGPERVTVVVADSEPVVNGKIQNLILGLGAARHDILVISDSDIALRPDYLKTMVAPLDDPSVGCVCTPYRAVRGDRWFERLELLTLNAEFVVNVMFACVTGASGFCLGASTALRRSTLEQIGGLEALADYLVEDFEMGRRIRARGLELVLQPYFVDSVIGLGGPGDWWRHHVYWDQNTRAARPGGFFFTVLTRAVPFALLFAAARLFDSVGLAVLAATLLVRFATTAVSLGPWGMNDREGLRGMWLLPLRDVAGLVAWALALTKTRFEWRGLEFGLTRGGRIVPREASVRREDAFPGFVSGRRASVRRAGHQEARSADQRHESLLG